MDSTQELKHRTKEETTPEGNENLQSTNVDNDTIDVKKQKRPATGKRGLVSLATAVALPVSLTLADISLFGSRSTHSKRFWFLPLWAFHLASLLYNGLMGVSAWLVWAQGGFHREPTAMALYLAQLVLSLLWGPVALSAGATRVGLGVCLVTVGLLFGCYKMFGRMNPRAGQLVVPCLAWAAFLTFVNLMFVYV